MPGIDETKELVGFLVALGNGVGETISSGKWSFGAVKNFVSAIQKALPALSGIDKVPEELLELSFEERDELHNYISNEFDLEDDVIESVMEDGLRIVLDLLTFVQVHFIKEKEEE